MTGGPIIHTAGLTLFAVLALASSPGRAESHDTTIEMAGTTLRISFAEPLAEQQVALTGWLRSVAESVRDVSGQFPVSQLRIRVEPYWGRGWGADSPVPFGRVTRRGGEQIELYVDPNRPIEDFYADWTATHEFSHLLLPAISWRHRWVSEGFASYYQNVLMARTGQYSTDTAIRKLTEGFARGRGSRPELSPNEAAREGIRTARYKIYWSGAAIALLADVTLREQSGGRESLDAVLGRFQACCLPSARRWTAPELFERLDSLSQRPVFMPLYRQYADSAGFPDVGEALDSPQLRETIFAVRKSTD